MMMAIIASVIPIVIVIIYIAVFGFLIYYGEKWK